MFQDLTTDELSIVSGGSDTVSTSEVLAAGAAMTGTTATVTCSLGLVPACAFSSAVTIVLGGAAVAVSFFED